MIAFLNCLKVRIQSENLELPFEIDNFSYVVREENFFYPIDDFEIRRNSDGTTYKYWFHHKGEWYEQKTSIVEEIKENYYYVYKENSINAKYAINPKKEMEEYYSRYHSPFLRKTEYARYVAKTSQEEYAFVCSFLYRDGFRGNLKTYKEFKGGAIPYTDIEDGFYAAMTNFVFFKKYLIYRPFIRTDYSYLCAPAFMNLDVYGLEKPYDLKLKSLDLYLAPSEGV